MSSRPAVTAGPWEAYDAPLSGPASARAGTTGRSRARSPVVSAMTAGGSACPRLAVAPAVSEVRRNGRSVTFRGTGVYNDRQPISFTATVVDGSPDSVVIFGAGQRFGGTLISGDLAVSRAVRRAH